MSVEQKKKVKSLIPGKLLKLVKGYYPNHLDLMRGLSVGAIWEYHIRSPTLDDNEKLLFHLKKAREDHLELGVGSASETPDLILYFTEEAIIELISSSPNAKMYYENYSKILKEGSGTRDLDYKMNKSTINMVKLGYRSWAKRYDFTEV